MHQRTLTKGLAVAAGLVTIVLTAAAFALSYEHLVRVALDNGVTNKVAAWTWPGTVDLFIVAGELLTLRAVLNGRTDRFAIMLMAVGSFGSIVLNVLGVGQGHPTMHYVVAGVPPVAALLAFGAVMRQIYELVGVQADSEADTAPDTVPDTVSVMATAPVQVATSVVDMLPYLSALKDSEDTADTGSGQVATEADTPQVTGLDEDTHQPTKPVKGPDPVDIAAAIEEIEARGVAVSGATLAAHFGVSGRTGRRYLKQIEQQPDMATA